MALFKKKNNDEIVSEEVVNNEVTEEINLENIPNDNLSDDTVTKAFSLEEDFSNESADKTIVVSTKDIVSDNQTQKIDFSIEDEPELDDDDEYEYVTPSYGKNAVMITLVSIVIGMAISYIVFNNQFRQEITTAYLQSGYMQTSSATATSNDIVEGKTAYVNGTLITGTYVELDTNQATATADDILEGYTAYASGVKITGTIKTYSGSNIITPSNKKITIPKGVYLSDDIIIIGDGNLSAGNIKKGVTIFGVTGTYTGD